nr:reverse transcriptase domain-containing protein [Tanacetum cinerariifolium]
MSPGNKCHRGTYFLTEKYMGPTVSLRIVVGEGIPCERSPANIPRRRRGNLSQRQVTGECRELSLEKRLVVTAIAQISSIVSLWYRNVVGAILTPCSALGYRCFYVTRALVSALTPPHLRRMSLSVIMKCTMAIRQLAYGTTPDAFVEYLKMSERANNDINVLDNSSLFDDLLDDKAPVAPYVVNDVEFEKGYYLANVLDRVLCEVMVIV